MSERLAEIEARVEAATPGPWHLSSPHGLIYMGRWFGLIAEVDKDEDADFLAAARSDIPWLLERVREAPDWGYVRRLESALEQIAAADLNLKACYSSARQALADSGEASDA